MGTPVPSDTQIESRWQRLCLQGRHIPRLIFANLHPQRFGATFHLLGVDRYARQLLQQLRAFFKADHRADGGNHARDRRGQGGIGEAQVLVAGAKTLTAAGAVIIGALQLQRPEGALEALPAPPGIAGQLPAGAATMGGLPVGMVGVEALLHSPCCQAQSLPSHGRLQRLQIQILQALTAQERFNVPQHLSGEKTVERGFF